MTIAPLCAADSSRSSLLAGCATRPVNPPVTTVDPDGRLSAPDARPHNVATTRATALVILTFSGGGTRAAAFAYGVLEVLRKTEVAAPRGNASGCSTRST